MLYEVITLGLRVAADRTTLGVPGLSVRLVDPRERGTVLATGVTDADGNAVLLVDREVADELARSRVEATVEVLGPKGKVIQRAERAVSPRA